MNGGYVTQSRVIAQPTLKYGYASSFSGYPTQVPIQDVSALVAPTIQETTSWRTSRQSESGEDQLHQSEVDNLSRTTRNGFTSLDPAMDSGHTFRTSTFAVKLSHPHVEIHNRDGGSYETYQGALLPSVNSNSSGIPAGLLKPHSLSWLEGAVAKDLGQRAILGCAPAQPQASTATLIGELISDGLPAGIGVNLAGLSLADRTSIARSAGGEFLNAQFGWLPLIADIRKAASSFMRADAILTQLQRDSGRIVRRRFSFPAVTDNTATELPVTYQVPYVPYRYYQHGVGSDRTIVTSRSYTKVWFSGAFQYYLPGFDSYVASTQTYLKMAQVLMGNQVTPEVLWELAPWSWLVDWKFRIGQLLSFAQLPADGLVIRYGYLMRHQKRETTYVTKSPIVFNNGWVTTPSITLRTERKERVQSTPYGFGVTEGDLNPLQWSILAALGLTRSDKLLRLVS